MTSTFNAIFQDRTTFLGSEIVTLDQLRPALESSYLAQDPVNVKRVAGFVKDVVKQQELWQDPILVDVESEGITVLAAGRHRIETMRTICDNYAINAAGKLIDISDDSETVALEVDPIEPSIRVLRYSVPDRAALVQFLQTHNGSRSMTASEKDAGKEYGGTLTPMQSLKVALKKALIRGFADEPLTLNGGVDVEVTDQTCALIAGALMGKNGVGAKSKYMTPANVQELADEFVTFTYSESTAFNSNFARDGYKEALEAFSSVEYDGVMFDAEGEELEDVSWLQYFASTIKTPAKAKKATKAEQMSAKLQAMADALRAAGIDADALLNA